MHIAGIFTKILAMALLFQLKSFQFYELNATDDKYVTIMALFNFQQDPESPRGYRLVGDICYEEASKVASAITPVPGGVGPMTIAMLLSNTLLSAKRIHNSR